MGVDWSAPLTAPPGFSATWREDYWGSRVVIVHGRIFRIDEAGGLWYVGQIVDGRVPEIDALTSPTRGFGPL